MIYLDNSATTRPFDAVIDRMAAHMREGYFNPSSLYAPAMAAERSLSQLSQTLCALAGGQDAILTSGGTEANNLAIFGALQSLRGPRAIVLSAIEHPSVMETARAAAKALGAQLTVLPVDETGRIRLDALDAALAEHPALLSIMQVNNEIGTVQPIDEIGRRLRAVSPQTLFHVDGVQGFLRVPLDMRAAQVDLYTVSAHKLHGPKGIGALLRRGNVRLSPLMHGGGHQGGIRSGTENMPGIVGFLAALETWAALPAEGMAQTPAEGMAQTPAEGMAQTTGEGMPHTPAGRSVAPSASPRDALPAAWLSTCRDIKTLLADMLMQAGAVINGPSPEAAAPHILSVSFPGVRGEVLLHALEARGILVSTGSACAAHGRKPSATLAAIGAKKPQIEGAIRISLGALNTREEAQEAARVIAQTAAELRPFVRR